MTEESFKRIEKQNEVIISLLGRMAFTPEKVRDTVAKKKQNPEKYIEGYNACDGVRNVNELADIIGVKQSTLSPILQEWAELGIIYEVEKSKGRFYKRLFPI
jgi:DNA-binding MarR family transcriptional regulator